MCVCGEGGKREREKFTLYCTTLLHVVLTSESFFTYLPEKRIILYLLYLIPLPVLSFSFQHLESKRALKTNGGLVVIVLLFMSFLVFLKTFSRNREFNLAGTNPLSSFGLFCLGLYSVYKRNAVFGIQVCNYWRNFKLVKSFPIYSYRLVRW